MHFIYMIITVLVGVGFIGLQSALQQRSQQQLIVSVIFFLLAFLTGLAAFVYENRHIIF